LSAKMPQKTGTQSITVNGILGDHMLKHNFESGRCQRYLKLNPLDIILRRIKDGHSALVGRTR
jgi:hypothetical protein